MNSAVNHPPHYADGKIEVIDFIEDKKLCFHLGNAVKYINPSNNKSFNNIDASKYDADSPVELPSSKVASKGMA